jgi:hypothetical protein
VIRKSVCEALFEYLPKTKQKKNISTMSSLAAFGDATATTTLLSVAHSIGHCGYCAERSDEGFHCSACRHAFCVGCEEKHRSVCDQTGLVTPVSARLTYVKQVLDEASVSLERSIAIEMQLEDDANLVMPEDDEAKRCPTPSPKKKKKKKKKTKRGTEGEANEEAATADGVVTPQTKKQKIEKKRDSSRDELYYGTDSSGYSGSESDDDDDDDDADANNVPLDELLGIMREMKAAAESGSKRARGSIRRMQRNQSDRRSLIALVQVMELEGKPVLARAHRKPVLARRAFNSRDMRGKKKTALVTPKPPPSSPSPLRSSSVVPVDVEMMEELALPAAVTSSSASASPTIIPRPASAGKATRRMRTPPTTAALSDPRASHTNARTS